MTAAALAAAFTDGVRTGRGYARLSRPHNTRLPMLAYIGAAHAGGLGVEATVQGCFVIVLAYAASAAYNDRHDFAIDAANGRDLPLVTGELHCRQADAFVMACVVALTVAMLLSANPPLVLVVAATIGASWLYSAPPTRVSDRGFVATALLAVLYIDAPLVIAWAQGARPVGVPVAAGLTICGAAIILHKDIRDECGDRLGGKRTPVVRYGVSVVTAGAAALFVTGTAILIAVRAPGIWLVPCIVALISTTWMHWSRSSRNRWLITQRVAFGAMVVSCLGSF